MAIPKHVTVIGSGMAGAAATYTLRKKDYDVTVIEQNDLLGGRVKASLSKGRL